MRRPYPIIDAHVGLGIEHHLSLSGDQLLAQMDAHDVAVSIARPMGAEVAVHYDRGNSRCLVSSPRFRALATASPWADDAVDILRRAQHFGAVGLYLHPTRQGFFPTDLIVEPLINLAQVFTWPVVIHTGTYIQSDILAVAELARRYPSIDFLCDSAGFTDMWFELPGLMADLPNLHYIASLIWPRAIANTIKNDGSGRILFGSGSPRDSLAAAIARIDALELSPDDHRSVMHDNAMRVFRLPPASTLYLHANH